MNELTWDELACGDQVRFEAGAPASVDPDLTYTVTELHAGPFISLRAYHAERGPHDVTLGREAGTLALMTRVQPWETLAARLPLMVQVVNMELSEYPTCPDTGLPLPPPTVRRVYLVTHVPSAESRVRAGGRPLTNLRGADRYFSAAFFLDASGAATLTLRGEALALTVLCQVARTCGWPLTLHDDGATTRVTLAVDTGEGVTPVEAFGVSVQGGISQSALILARALRLAVEVRAVSGVSPG